MPQLEDGEDSAGRERDVEADQRDCLVHGRGEVSPPKSSHPAKHARHKMRQSEQSEAKRSPPLPSTAQRSRAQRSSSSTAIRSTAQLSEAQHSDPKHSTAGKRMQGKVLWPIKHSGARGVKGHSTAQRKWPFYVRPTGRTSHSAQGFLTAQNPMHNRCGPRDEAVKLEPLPLSAHPTMA